MGCKRIIEKETEATIQGLGLRAWYGNRNPQIMENQMETEIEIGYIRLRTSDLGCSLGPWDSAHLLSQGTARHNAIRNVLSAATAVHAASAEGSGLKLLRLMHSRAHRWRFSKYRSECCYSCSCSIARSQRHLLNL